MTRVIRAHRDPRVIKEFRALAVPQDRVGPWDPQDPLDPQGPLQSLLLGSRLRGGDRKDMALGTLRAM